MSAIEPELIRVFLYLQVVTQKIISWLQTVEDLEKGSHLQTYPQVVVPEKKARDCSLIHMWFFKKNACGCTFINKWLLLKQCCDCKLVVTQETDLWWQTRSSPSAGFSTNGGSENRPVTVNLLRERRDSWGRASPAPKMLSEVGLTSTSFSGWTWERKVQVSYENHN